MTISAGSILKDPTISPSGGTAQSFSSLGGTLERKNVYFDGTQFGSRVEAEFTVKPPRVSASAPNGYTQARETVLIKSPLALDNGNTTINTISITMAADIELTDAENLTMRKYAAQILTDTEFSEFWNGQSVE